MKKLMYMSKSYLLPLCLLLALGLMSCEPKEMTSEFAEEPKVENVSFEELAKFENITIDGEATTDLERIASSMNSAFHINFNYSGKTLSIFMTEAALNQAAKVDPMWEKLEAALTKAPESTVEESGTPSNNRITAHYQNHVYNDLSNDLAYHGENGTNWYKFGKLTSLSSPTSSFAVHQSFNGSTNISNANFRQQYAFHNINGRKIVLRNHHESYYKQCIFYKESNYSGGGYPSKSILIVPGSHVQLNSSNCYISGSKPKSVRVY